jgi:hypothetical protein
MKIYLVLVLSLVTSFTTFAEKATENNAVMLKVKMSQTCFHSSARSSSTGKLDGWACDNDDKNQKFVFIQTEDEWFQLRSVSTGLCVEVKDANKRHHVNTALADCNQQDHQLWKKTVVKGDWFTLSAKHSSRCLDLDHGVSRNGNRFIQHGCIAHDNKTWLDKQLFKVI